MASLQRKGLECHGKVPRKSTTEATPTTAAACGATPTTAAACRLCSLCGWHVLRASQPHGSQDPTSPGCAQAAATPLPEHAERETLWSSLD